MEKDALLASPFFSAVHETGLARGFAKREDVRSKIGVYLLSVSMVTRVCITPVTLTACVSSVIRKAPDSLSEL